MGKLTIKDRLGRYGQYLPISALSAIEKAITAIDFPDQNVRNRQRYELRYIESFLERLEFNGDTGIRALPPYFIEVLMKALGFESVDELPPYNTIVVHWKLAERAPSGWTEIEWNFWSTYLAIKGATELRITNNWFWYKMTIERL